MSPQEFLASDKTRAFVTVSGYRLEMVKTRRRLFGRDLKIVTADILMRTSWRPGNLSRLVNDLEQMIRDHGHDAVMIPEVLESRLRPFLSRRGFRPLFRELPDLALVKMIQVDHLECAA